MRRLESHPEVVSVGRYPDTEGNAADGNSLKLQQVAEEGKEGRLQKSGR
jgi:hypothetical protein